MFDPTSKRIYATSGGAGAVDVYKETDPDHYQSLAGGGMCFPLFHYVKDQFDTTGDPEFVIDVEQIVAHRVLGDVQFQRNFLVWQS